MTKAILSIKQWGDDLVICLPAAIAQQAHLRLNQCVIISVEADHVVITPINDAPLTLEQRLASFDPERHSGEIMTTSQTIVD
ncbi:MAG: PbsX family transcriptional regulator [Methylococcaceae bacterium]|jgi:antitoxin MazE|nr:PbsX family transcriptional regulator [Methylococcaceae bacterium]MDZ4156382.1 PbsX family transcriptional regulator [Methylococcales bacterium]MDP2394643.1 PbsX family transcriptional regulator [Methylococcaceae bacterium]MDP3019111.1 PbsX family transcriptional regulator [Methylococcaceae bacterium]MDP3390327.1 PbsX family transcriptional regulator [Methylococcaceae bacterium]